MSRWTGTRRAAARATVLVVLVASALSPGIAVADPTPPATAKATGSPTDSSTPTTSAPAATPTSATPTATPTGTTTGTSTSPKAPPAGISPAAASLLAQLTTLQQQALSLQAGLATQQAAANTAIATYTQTTLAVQAAVATADQASAALASADQLVASTRGAAQRAARDAYVNAVPHTSSALLLTSNPDDFEFALLALTYLSERTNDVLSRYRNAQQAAAGLAEQQRAALAQAQELQTQATTQQTAALASLQTAEAAQGVFAGQVAALSAQAAAGAAAFGTSPADEAAYQEFLAGLAALTSPATTAATTYVAGGPGLAPLPGTSWVRPLTTYEISSCYCLRGTEFHHGVDLAAPLGTPIYAVGAGTVVAAGPANGFGNWVVIDHHDGSFSIYGHMRVLATTVGAVVAPGTLIAFVGDEGESTGPHLHFEVRVGSYANATDSTDPVLWLARRGVTL